MTPRRYGPLAYVPITRRPKLTWPGNARMALWVNPNIEFFGLDDVMPGNLNERVPREHARIPNVRNWAVRDYGNRVGIWRIMEVLTRYGIRASAALNSEVCDHHPQIIEEAGRLGWELIGHNETNALRLTEMDEAEERGAVRATIDRIEAASGRRPVGWLGAGLAETWNTLDYLAEAGIRYVCDWVNDDQPYFFEIGNPPLVSLSMARSANCSARDRDRRRGDRATVFAAHDLGHRAAIGQRRGMQKGLRDAVAKGGVQPPAVMHQSVDFLRQIAKAVGRSAVQHFAHHGAQEPEMLLGLKQRIAPRHPGEDHVGAVAERDLAVVEQEHHRDRGFRLDDFLEAGALRRARVGKAVSPRARLDRGQIPVEEPRPPDDRDHVADLCHGAAFRPNRTIGCGTLPRSCRTTAARSRGSGEFSSDILWSLPAIAPCPTPRPERRRTPGSSTRWCSGPSGR